jgi:membrane protein
VGSTGAWRILWLSAGEWSRHNRASLGAAISFYTTFSLAPVLTVAIALAAFFFGEPRARTRNSSGRSPS